MIEPQFAAAGVTTKEPRDRKSLGFFFLLNKRNRP
jgi:hypothetical protein